MTTFIEKMAMIANSSVAEALNNMMLKLTAKYHPYLTQEILECSKMGERTLDLNYDVNDFNKMSHTPAKLYAIDAFRA